MEWLRVTFSVSALLSRRVSLSPTDALDEFRSFGEAAVSGLFWKYVPLACVLVCVIAAACVYLWQEKKREAKL